MKRRELFTSFGDAPASACTPGVLCGADLIPNAVLRTHEGEPVRFYDDLVKDRQVIITMMYASCTTFCPAVTARLVQLHHDALSERMGKDLFLYSITLKPEEDDPATLKAYAEMHGALLPGWTFLTGDRYDIDTLRYALFRHDHISIDLDLDMHAGSLRIINDRINRWLHADAYASQRTLLERISWADTPKSFAEQQEDNRRLQEEIDKEIDRYGYRKIA